MNNTTKRIKIGNMNYLIKVVDSDNKMLIMGDYYKLGVCHKDLNEIYLANNMKPEMFKRVLIHELTHAFIFVCGMEQVKWEEENIADFVEAHLLEIYEIYQKVLGDLLNED